jgi:ribokinase
MPIAIKRAYEAASPEDGYRILVDGLWPRGMTKAQLKSAAWMFDMG